MSPLSSARHGEEADSLSLHERAVYVSDGEGRVIGLRDFKRWWEFPTALLSDHAQARWSLS